MAANLQGQLDKFSSYTQLSGLLERIDGRGKDKVIEAKVEVMVDKIRTMEPLPEVSVGPTPYEQSKAQEDEWE